MSRIPPTLRRYLVQADTLERTQQFLDTRGRDGLEATVLWLGRIINDTTAEVLAPYAPEQIAYSSDDGVAVEVTADGLSRLIAELPDGLFVLCRVHSHPGAAYHSELDDQNMIIAHPGAISIVVPNFGRGVIDLPHCSVNELKEDASWREMTPEEVQTRFEVTR